MRVDSSILGKPVVDRVTGFRGIAVGHVAYLTGCHQTLVVPKVGENGEYRDGHWFDDQRLELGSGATVTLDNGSTPGGDATPSRNY